MATGDTDILICSDALLMLGASPISSFTEGTDEANTENIFNAGVAGGVSFERQRGRLRVETEWLQRDFWADNNKSLTRDVLTDNWSVMANIWRDFMFTNKLGCYGGGGIGGGGFAFTDNLDASGSG